MWLMYGGRGIGLNKRRGIHKLGAELTIAVIVSALAGLFFYSGLNVLGQRMLNRILFKKEVTLAREKRSVDSLQAYLWEHNLSSEDVSMLDAWDGVQKDFLIALKKGDQILYSTDGVAAVTYINKEAWDWMDDWKENRGQVDALSQEPQFGLGIPRVYRLQFADGPVEAYVSYFFRYKYYATFSTVNSVLSVAVFMIIFLRYIRRKVSYITLLEQEMQILKGGDLDYTITVKGKDELTSLAGEMDAMRCAVRERQEQEEEARNANRDLVTAMSHDLRTPLTALLGYVDILQLDRHRDEEQYRRCLKAVCNKAYQIKDMSDKMFEYFTVYGKDREEMEIIEVNAMEFLGQVVEESLFDMENHGFVIERSADQIDCCLMVDIALARRVFGNIFSNLLKYADSSRPVTVEYKQKEDRLSIRFANYVCRDFEEKESSNIGLKTCGKIMKFHKGCFTCNREGDMFVAELEFLVLKSVP